MIQRLGSIIDRSDQKKHLLPLLAIIAIGLAAHSVFASDVARPDQPLYLRTLQLMSGGQTYYEAAGRAFSEVFGYLPSQVRSVRFPTEFLLLDLLPEAAWRWATAVPAFTSLWAAYVIGRRSHAWQGVVAVALTSTWLWLAANTLYLHAELWGLPFALAAVAFASREQWRWMVVCATTAVLFRETYGLLFVLLIFHKPVRSWLLAVGVLAAGGGLHWHLASRILVPSGRETPLDGLHELGPTITTFTFQLQTVGRLAGLLVIAVASIALLALARRDRLSVLILTHSILLAVICFYFGRTYWGLVFGPLLWATTPWILDALRQYRKEPAS